MFYALKRRLRRSSAKPVAPIGVPATQRGMPYAGTLKNGQHVYCDVPVDVARSSPRRIWFVSGDFVGVHSARVVHCVVVILAANGASMILRDTILSRCSFQPL